MSGAAKIRSWMIGAAVLCAFAGVATRAAAVDYGRVVGTVRDGQGNPLMGATVLLNGPHASATESLGSIIERVTTNAQGDFTIEHLVPGWYTLRVVSASRVPAMRDSVRVAAGETTQQKFVLDDFFSPFHMQKAKADFSSWGSDWKWILRTSDDTRLVLRYRRVEKTSKGRRIMLPSDERVAGLMPGSTHADTLSEDPGSASVVAYLKPLSQESDLLVAASSGSMGLENSGLVASFRRNLNTRNPEELSLAVHNLDFASGGMNFSAAQGGANSISSAQGVVVSWVRKQRLSNSLTVTTGLEADYLRAGEGAKAVSPRIEADYQASPSTKVLFTYGEPIADGNGNVMDRVESLNRFPRVSLSGSKPQLETVRHAELAVQRDLGRTSRVEFAVYSDSLHNAAVWVVGNPTGWVAQAALPNGEGSGWAVNAGSYQSKGFRADYQRRIGQYIAVSVAYAYGDALSAANGIGHSTSMQTLASRQISNDLRRQATSAIAGRISARIPVCHTQIVTAYTWLPAGRVTVADPYDLAAMGLGPFLNVEIRQPLPSIAFLPAHFEALADFRNLLGEGSVAAAESDGNPVVLTSAYRTLRGGFAVRF